MEARIQASRVLEFKALVLSKNVFDQLKDVTMTEELDPIGWVQEPKTPRDWVIAQSDATGLVKVSRVHIFEFTWAMWALNGEEWDREVERTGLSPTEYLRGVVDGFFATLPQIFLK